MFTAVLATVIKTVVIPIIGFNILRNTFLGDSNAMLAVAVTLTLVNLLSLIPKFIKIIFNGMLFRAKNIWQILITIAIEVFATLGFWYYLIMNY